MDGEIGFVFLLVVLFGSCSACDTNERVKAMQRQLDAIQQAQGCEVGRIIDDMNRRRAAREGE